MTFPNVVEVEGNSYVQTDSCMKEGQSWNIPLDAEIQNAEKLKKTFLCASEHLTLHTVFFFFILHYLTDHINH